LAVCFGGPGNPKVARFLLAKAQDYVAQILGHEGPGSMHSILKGRLALGLRSKITGSGKV